MSEDVVAALHEAEQIVKKQKVCVDTSAECIDALIRELHASKDKLASAGQPQAVVKELNKKVQQLRAVNKVSKSTKDYHKCISNLGKIIDKAFEADISKASRPNMFDADVLNEVVMEHLLRQGHFDVADTFAHEAGIRDSDELKQKYLELHAVLQQIRCGNVDAALQWARQHRAALAACSGLPRHPAHDHDSVNSNNNNKDGNEAAAPSQFEFKLHRMQFIRILTTDGQMAALQYARAHFAPFACEHMRAIQQLMGCLAYAHNLASSPYRNLVSHADARDDVVHDFIRLYCGLLGQSYEGPLLVSVAAGSVVMPSLIKLMSVMTKSSSAWQDAEQLPIELELGSEFVFHSVFACPVSRTHSTADNPPKMLPCGHVLCHESIVSIAKNRAFKCPYCPIETTMDSCRQIYFPDVE